MKAHLDFTDGTSAWIDFGDVLLPLNRWTVDIVNGEGFAIDREKAFPPIKFSPFRNEDVATFAEITRALERLYPRPEGKRYR